jgi:hypothetical protein
MGSNFFYLSIVGDIERREERNANSEKGSKETQRCGEIEKNTIDLRVRT